MDKDYSVVKTSLPFGVNELRIYWYITPKNQGGSFFGKTPYVTSVEEENSLSLSVLNPSTLNLMLCKYVFKKPHKTKAGKRGAAKITARHMAGVLKQCHISKVAVMSYKDFKFTDNERIMLKVLKESGIEVV